MSLMGPMRDKLLASMALPDGDDVRAELHTWGPPPDYSMKPLLDSAAEQIEDFLAHEGTGVTQEQVDRRIHEIADSLSPAHTEVLLHMALVDPSLATQSTEIAEMEYQPCAQRCLQLVVYDRLEEAMTEVFDRLRGQEGGYDGGDGDDLPVG